MKRRILATILAVALCFNYTPCYAVEASIETEAEPVVDDGDTAFVDSTEQEETGEESITTTETDVEKEAENEETLEAVTETELHDSAKEAEEMYSSEGAITESVNYQFVQNDDGSQKLVISGNGAMPDYGEWPDAPWGINPVDHEPVHEIEVQEGITAIGSRCFVNFNNVTKVTLPDSLQRIGSSAFYGAGNLNSITVPGSVKDLDAYAFMYADGLTTVTLSEGVTSIGECAFWGCYNLQTLEVPRSLTSFGGYPFGHYDEDQVLPQVIYAGSEEEWNSISLGENIFIGNIVYNNSTEEPCTHENKEEISSTEATCTEAGHVSYRCIECGEIIEEDIPAVGHSWAKISYSIEPSENSFGSVFYKCSICHEEETHLVSYIGSPVDISFGESEIISLDECQAAILRFTPEEDGWYSFYSAINEGSMSSDSVCRLFDADWNEIGADDDSGEANNFSLNANLTAESEYYLVVFGFYFANISMEINVEAGSCIHSSKEMISSTEATCTEEGYATYKCLECGEIFEEIIPPGHNQIDETIVEPTGESFGYILFKCSRCQEELDRIHISCLAPAFEISKDESVSFKLDKYQVAILKFTPGEDGWYSFFSENDTQSEDFDSFCRLYDEDWNWLSEDDDFGGSFNFKLTEDLKGGKEYNLVAFGNGYRNISMKVTVESQCLHSSTEIVSSTEATCTEDGHILYQCLECGEILDITLTKLDHSWIDGEIIKESSCTESGIRTVTCQLCGENGTESIPPCHTWSEYQVTIEPTENSFGFVDLKCTKCEEEEKRIISYSTSVVDLQGGARVDLEEYQAKRLKFTPEEDGFYTFSASGTNDYPETNTSVCILFDSNWNEISSAEASPYGYSHFNYFGEYLEAGEQYNLVIYEKSLNSISCTVYMDNYCSHPDWGEGEITKEPTCTESGIRTFTCQLCGETRTEGISPTGHNWSEYVTTVEPTCTEYGNSICTCLNCGDAFSVSLAPLGHNYGDGYECIICGEEKPAFKTKYCFDFSTGEGWTEISKYTGRGGDVVIPEWLDGGSVKTIGWDAFYGCDNITSITFPECLTEISRNAFYNCDGLTEVIIPASVKTVDYFAFAGCDNLKWVKVLSDNTYFDYQALPSGCNVICKKDSRSHQSAIQCNTNINCYWTEPCDEHTYELTEVIKEATHTREGLQRIYCSVCNDYYEEAILPEGHSFNKEGICTICGTDRDTALFEADFEYELDEDGNAIIKSYSGHEENLTIPAEIEGHPVTYVGYDQDVDFFKNDFQLKTLTISDGIINLYYTCRNCESLTSVSIPDSVTYLDGTFSGCTNLTNIVLPYGVEFIGDDTFKDCKSLTELVTPDTVRFIGNSAFEGCENLSRVVLPVGISTINKKTFKDCNSLSSISIPENVTYIRYTAFDNCTDLSRITIWAEDVFVDFNVTDPEEGVDGPVEVFNGCSSDLILVGKADSTVQSYAESHNIAFEVLNVCEEHSFDIGTIIQEPTCRFEGKRKRTCSVCNYATIEAVPANGHHWSEDDICTVCGEGIFVIWDNEPGTCVVGRYNGDSENVVIPAEIDGKTVILVDRNVFWHREDIVTVELPDTIKWIDDSSFNGCRNLVSINLPSQVTSIGDYAFTNCSSLTDLVISDSVTSIGEFAFSNCGNLTIHCKLNSVAHRYALNEGIPYEIIEDETPDQENTDLTVDHDVTVEIPDWTSANISFVPEVNGIYEFTSLGLGSLYNFCALYNEDNLYLGGDDNYERDSLNFCYQAELTAGKTYRLNVWNFSNMGGTLRVSVRYLGDAPDEEKSDYSYTVFEDGSCQITGYTGRDNNLVIPETMDGHTVVSIGDYAFYDNAMLSGVIIPNTVTFIGKHAFSCCPFLEEVIIPVSCTNIDDHAFAFDPWLEFVTFVETSSVRNIMNKVKSLFSVQSNNTGRIGAYAFVSCNSLNNVVLPNTFTVIDDHAFDDCGNLSEITLPDCLVSIGTAAFTNCNNLVSVTIPDQVTTIGENAFSNCVNLQYVSIPDSVESIAENAFASSDNVRIICSNDSYANAYARENNIPLTSTTPCEEHTPGEYVIDQEPTFDTEGLKHYICSVCGEEVFETIPALGYRLYGYQVVLNGNFDLKYYVEMNNELLSRDDVKMRFTIGDTVSEASAIRKAGKYQIFMCELGAAQISDTITAELVYDGESHEVSSYSVREYLNTLIQNPEQKAEYYEAQELAQALLNYSAYAQLYFGYNLEDLANSILDTDSVAGLIDSDVAGSISAEIDDQIQTDDFSYYGASLICESDTYLRMYFYNNNDLTLDEIQEKYNIFVAGISNPSYETGIKGNLFYITIKDIPAAELDSRFIIHLDSNEAKSYIVYSPAIYIRSSLESASVSQELKNMCKALWLYNRAANEYYERYAL